MTIEEVVKLYDPSNAENLTDKQLDDMRNLTLPEIAALATAFPNKPSGNSYLRLYDSRLPEKGQLYPLSSWANLHNLVGKLRLGHYKPFTFTSLYKPQPAVMSTRNLGQPVQVNKKKTTPKAAPIDLTPIEVEGLPGTKKGERPKVTIPKIAKGVTKKKLPEDDK